MTLSYAKQTERVYVTKKVHSVSKDKKELAQGRWAVKRKACTSLRIDQFYSKKRKNILIEKNPYSFFVRQSWIKILFWTMSTYLYVISCLISAVYSDLFCFCDHFF